MKPMTTTFRGHFDGKVIVPDEPADLPVGTPLAVKVTIAKAESAPLTLDERREAFEQFLSRVRTRPVPHLPDEAISRESIYEDR